MSNVNNWTSVWQRFEQSKAWFNSLASLLDHYNNEENSIKSNAVNTQQEERINDSISLNKLEYQPRKYTEVTNQIHNESRKAKLASMITQYWIDNWVDITWTPDEIINTYINWLDDQRRQYVWNRFADYTHSAEFQEDSKEFAMEMWWREKNRVDYVWDNISWLREYLTYWPDAVIRANRRVWIRWNNLFQNNNQETLDILNLAEEVYWAKSNVLKSLTDEQWNDLEWYIANSAEQVEKQSNPENIVLEWWLWTLMTAMWLHPIFNTLIWEWTQLPYSQDVLLYLQEKSWDLGYYINQGPLLSDYREWLITDESKREFDELTWQAVIAALLELIFRTPWFFKWDKTKVKTNNWWWDWWWGNWTTPMTPSMLKEKLWIALNNADKEKIIENFEKKRTKSETQADLTQEELAKKITNSEYEDKDAVIRALNNLEWKWEMFKFDDVIEWANKAKEKIVDDENIILKNDRWLYKKNDIMEWTKTDLQPEWFDFVSSILDDLEDIYKKWVADWRVTEDIEFVNKMKAKYKSEWLSKFEINEILRRMPRVVDMYEKLWDFTKKWDLRSKFRDLRRMWKDYVRKWFNKIIEWVEKPLEELDMAYHDYLKLIEYLEWQRKSAYNQKWRIPPRWKLRNLIANTVSSVWDSIFWTFKRVLKKRARVWNLDAASAELLLNEMMQDFDFAWKKAWIKNNLKWIQESISKLNEIADKIDNLEIPETSNVKFDKKISADLSMLESYTKQYNDIMYELLKKSWVSETKAKKVKKIIQQSLFWE